MQTATTQSNNQNQAAQNARDNIKVEGMQFPDLFEDDNAHGEHQGDAGSADFSAANPSKTPALPTDPEKLKSIFDISVAGIKTKGETLPMRVQAFAKATVLDDLGEIVGVMWTFFVGASKQQIDMLKDQLWKQVDMKRNANTTECHLLSRIYRGADRRKASADAKVLKAALEAKVTQADFPAWVKKEGGYDAIVKRSSTTQKKKAGPQAPKKPDPQDLWAKAGKAVSALVGNGQYREVFTFDKTEWPDLYEKVCPKDRGYSRLVVVNSTGDDVHFHILESFCPYSPGYAHKHPVNVDGTSANTWPEWMLAKPDDADSSDDDSGHETEEA